MYTAYFFKSLEFGPRTVSIGEKQGPMHGMEDMICIHTTSKDVRYTFKERNFIKSQFLGLAVLDGHYKADVAHYASTRLFQEFEKQMGMGKGVELALSDTMATMDDEILADNLEGGTTVVVAVLFHHEVVRL